MKKIFLFIMVCLLTISVRSQNEKRFDCEIMPSGNYLVSPLFDQSKGEGNIGLASFSDKEYFNNLFSNVVKEVLKEKQDSLHSTTYAKVTFNQGGIILNCLFFINAKDRKIISDDDLYLMYNKLKNLKLDMSKVKIIPFPDKFVEKEYNYSEIMFPLISIEKKSMLRKAAEDKMKNK